ncbi:MAG TPA: transcription antitermination factor NusB, partial [Spirochaetia bacterium]|nr:transcription antitermination factor NusB [Spirochaetia bacterium]
MGSRRKARIVAFQTIYSWDFSRSPLGDLLEFYWLDDEKKESIGSETLDFARLLVSGTIENIEYIDETIKQHLKNWDFSRLSRVDLAVLRMSVYSLLYQREIPESVTIDEAIDIGKEFGTDDSYRFING